MTRRIPADGREAIAAATRWALPLALIVLALAMNAALVPATLDLLDRNRYDDFTLVYESARSALDGGGLVWTPKSTGELNINPPAFHLWVLPVALLPFRLAAWAWIGLVAGALALSFRLIDRTLGGASAGSCLWVALALLLFPGAYAVIVSGGIAFGLMLPMTLAWREARAGRWMRSGAWLGGVAALKLFVAIFLVYLAVRRQWRALGAALVVLVLVTTAGVLAFGFDAYTQWSRALSSVTWEAGLANGSLRAATVRAVELGALGPGSALAWWLAAAAGVIAVTAIAVVRTGDVDGHFAMLLPAALLLSPLGWVHYLVLATGPVLVVLARNSGPRRPTRSTIALAVLAVVALALPYPLLYHLASAAPAPWRWLLSSASTWGLLAVWWTMVAGRMRPATQGGQA